MLSVEEMSAWSLDEIQGEIRRLLPKDHQFRAGWDPEVLCWHTCFERFGEEPDPVVVWEDWNSDERVSLLNAFGQLWAKQQPQLPPDSPWHRRQELTAEHVRQKALELADPEDLDPDEIKSVYESVRGK